MLAVTDVWTDVVQSHRDFERIDDICFSKFLKTGCWPVTYKLKLGLLGLNGGHAHGSVWGRALWEELCERNQGWGLAGGVCSHRVAGANPGS